LFSSHQLDIVERLCDDLVIIADGRIRANGTREQLREEHSSPRFEIHTGYDAGWIRDVPDVTVVDFDGGYAVFEAATDAASQAVLQQATQRGTVLSFGQQRPSLATIFKEIVQ
jgi:ABC-2 type transport system ATP-binding protein